MIYKCINGYDIDVREIIAISPVSITESISSYSVYLRGYGEPIVIEIKSNSVMSVDITVFKKKIMIKPTDISIDAYHVFDISDHLSPKENVIKAIEDFCTTDRAIDIVGVNSSITLADSDEFIDKIYVAASSIKIMSMVGKRVEDDRNLLLDTWSNSII